MHYMITDKIFYIGKDCRGRPTPVTAKERAFTFKTRAAADNFLKCIPDGIKKYNWEVCEISEGSDETMLTEIKKFGNPTKTTALEDENFDICEFFTNTIQIMSQIDRFIANMIF